MTFEEFCNDHDIQYYREPFYYYLMSVNFNGNTIVEFETQWKEYIDKVIGSLLA